jgi:hypothetical protein
MKLRRETIKRLIQEELSKILENEKDMDWSAYGPWFRNMYDNVIVPNFRILYTKLDLDNNPKLGSELADILRKLNSIRLPHTMREEDLRKELKDVYIPLITKYNFFDITKQPSDLIRDPKFQALVDWSGAKVEAPVLFTQFPQLSKMMQTSGTSKVKPTQDLDEYFTEVEKGILKDQEGGGVDRSSKLEVLKYFKKQVNAISMGKELDLGPWFQHLGQYWEKGGIYNDGLQDMPGYKLFQEYMKKIGPKAKTAYANK